LRRYRTDEACPLNALMTPSTNNALNTNVRIGGMLIGYYLICPRKAWLSMRGLWMEQESEAVALGRLIDETSYTRRRSQIDLEADAPCGARVVGRIDGADLKEGVLHEVKKGRSCEDAHRWQLRFYLWLLQLCGVMRSDGAPFTGLLDYPKLRRTEAVTLQPDEAVRLDEVVAALRDLGGQQRPPPRIDRRAFCKRCAFEDLCYG